MWSFASPSPPPPHISPSSVSTIFQDSSLLSETSRTGSSYRIREWRTFPARKAAQREEVTVTQGTVGSWIFCSSAWWTPYNYWGPKERHPRWQQQAWVSWIQPPRHSPAPALSKTWLVKEPHRPWWSWCTQHYLPNVPQKQICAKTPLNSSSYNSFTNTRVTCRQRRLNILYDWQDV